MHSDDCIPAADLAAFASGRLGPAQLDHVAEHVEACADCAAALAGLGSNDSLLSPLRDRPPLPTTDDGLAEECVRAALAVEPALPLDGSRRLGRFELLGEVGGGSFGRVFKAHDPDLGRLVAVKVLRAGALAGRAEADRFLREARSAAQLRHPNIVAVYDAGRTEDGTPYLVEEFVDGVTLADLVARARPGPREAAELAATLADALAVAHTHGVIHRDLKPANVLLRIADCRLQIADLPERERQPMQSAICNLQSAIPMIADFGLAKCDAEDPELTGEGEVLGTPAYMSPEQARGEGHKVDGRTDVYSLGVVLYELLTGERPFRGNRRMLLAQVRDDEPRPPRRLNDRIPRDLETVCLKAMAKLPARRYATAADLAADLRRWLRGEPVQARPAGPLERLGRWCVRNPLAAGLLVALTAGAAIGFRASSRLSEHLIHSAALESAAQQAEVFDLMNEYYSANVVQRARTATATHDYAARDGAIPLPATLTIELGRRLAERGETGTEVRLYSDHPFRSRSDGGPRDDFEREALDLLRGRPEEPVHRFEDYQGRPVLRYATARRMRKTCVRCHNEHPDSTKHDWREGDVRGVLEIIRPLDRDVARTRAGLHGVALTFAAVLVPLAGLSLLALRRRRTGTV